MKCDCSFSCLKHFRKSSRAPLTFELKDLDFTEAEVLLLFAVVSDVHELTGVAEAVVAKENGLFGLKLPFEFGARLVHGLVSFQQFCEKKKKPD